MTYVHNQSSPSASWTVIHSLGKYPAISVVDTGGSTILPIVQHPRARGAAAGEAIEQADELERIQSGLPPAPLYSVELFAFGPEENPHILQPHRTRPGAQEQRIGAATLSRHDDLGLRLLVCRPAEELERLGQLVEPEVLQDAGPVLLCLVWRDALIAGVALGPPSCPGAEPERLVERPEVSFRSHAISIGTVRNELKRPSHRLWPVGGNLVGEHVAVKTFLATTVPEQRGHPLRELLAGDDQPMP